MFLRLFDSFLIWSGLPAGLAVIMWLNARKLGDKSAAEAWLTGAVVLPLGVGLWILFTWIGKHPSVLALLFFVAGAAAGAFGGLYYLRHHPQLHDSLAKLWTKRSIAERNRRTDVRDMSAHLPKVEESYDPFDYIDLKKGIFIGLDEDRKPVYISFKDWPRMPHMMVAGASGTGKGVCLGVIGAQWLMHGEAVFLHDPKDDEYGPHVMARAAALAGVPHHFINLREKQLQFNLFDDASADEIEELFVAGFGLNDTGAASDFYAIADRKWAGIIARKIAEKGMTASEAYFYYSEDLEEQAPKFGGKLRELAEVDAVNAPIGKGISLKKIIEDGGSCYIVGHMRHEKLLRIQKMILVRLLQIAERRDRLAGDLRPVAVILDEFKYHISRSALEGLGAARDKGVHVTLAFQSLSDLYDCGALPGEAVEGSVIDNCKIKLAYKVESPDTAEWLARLSGKILVDDESRTVARNLALAESLEIERQIRAGERYYIDENMLTNLPKTIAVVYGLGLARLTQICPIKVSKHADNITVKAVAPAVSPFKAAQKLELTPAVPTAPKSPSKRQIDPPEELEIY